MIPAGPIVSVVAAQGWLLGEGRAGSSPSALGLYWACQISEKNLRAENSWKTGLRGWPGAVSQYVEWSVG